MAMEERCKLDLPEILREYVFEPLGVDAWIGSSPFAAAVDGIDSQYAGTWLEPYGPFWRSLMLPWACLTMRAQQLLQLVQAFGDREFLGSAFDQASRPHTSDLPGGFVDSSPFLGHRSTKTLSWKKANWGLGVEFPGEKRPHYAPALASSNSFGHIGSSGVLAWCDPEYDTAWAICGCRTTDSGWLMRWSPAIGTICLGDIQQLPKGA